jgi:hypothetical protein
MGVIKKIKRSILMNNKSSKGKVSPKEGEILMILFNVRTRSSTLGFRPEMSLRRSARRAWQAGLGALCFEQSWPEVDNDC